MKSIVLAGIALSRWKEHILFTVPLSLLGGYLALEKTGVDLSRVLPLVLVTFANFLAVSFAFQINEIEDKEDDLAAGRDKNVVSAKVLSVRKAWFISIFTLLAALILYFLVGDLSFYLGVTLIVLGFLYSWKPIRLKALPAVDIISHSLMLGGLIVLIGYFAYPGQPGLIVPVFLAAVAFSAYGQFYNQIRDFRADQRSKIKNTSILLGKHNAEILMWVCFVAGSVLVAYSFLAGILSARILVIGGAVGLLAWLLARKVRG